MHKGYSVPQDITDPSSSSSNLSLMAEIHKDQQHNFWYLWTILAFRTVAKSEAKLKNTARNLIEF